MINLLPPEYADKIRYSRKNSMLVQTLVWVGLANLGLVLILIAGSLYISRQSGHIQAQIQASEKQLKAQNLDEVERQSQQITNNIKTINQVLSKEVLFSEVIQEVGKIIPSGSVLSSISLTQVSGSIDLMINSRDQNSAVQAAANLNDPKNNLFEKVDVINVSCSGSNPSYPCSSTFKALFSPTAQDRFLKLAKGTTR